MKKIYALALGCAALLATSSCSDDNIRTRQRHRRYHARP